MKKFFTLRATFGLIILIAGLISSVEAQVTLGTSPYTQNFNSIASGLPTGWTVRTGATNTALGTSNTLTTTTTDWTSTTGAFANFASGNSPSASGDNSATQAARTDRALGLRQTSTYANPGGAFVLQLANTSGKAAFQLAFKLQSLDSGSPRITTWKVDYGTGATPTSFTTAPTIPASITTGGSTFTNQSIMVDFGSALDNLTGPVWIRIVTLTANTGSGNSPTTGIDDVSLSWSAGGPSLSAGALTAFGPQCINAGPYGPNSFTITGSHLTTAAVTVGALSGYSYSTTSGGSYTPTLSLTQPGGAFSQQVFVQFNPTAVQSYNGNIPVGGGGATGINVAASGSGVNTAPTVATGSASAITSSSASVAGTLNTTGSCGAITAYGIEYSTTPGFANGTGTQVASTNLSGTAFSSALSGLDPCTTYYTHAYATHASGTTYGAQTSFTTAPIEAPVATTATGILGNGFTANWSAVTGATGYQLDVSTSATFGGPGGVLVGWNFNDENAIADAGIPANNGKTITKTASGAIGYNAGVTGNPDKAASCDGWDNGNGTKYWLVDLVTTGYYGLTLSSAQTSSGSGPKNFKVQYSTDGTTWADVPGATVFISSANTWSTTSTLDQIPLPPACDNQAQLRLRWIMTTNTRVDGSSPVPSGGTSRIDNIVVEAASAPSFLPGYENLPVGNVTSKAVTGLDPLTTYYYRVRSIAGCSSATSSNTISVTTSSPGCTDPLADNYDPTANPDDGSCTYCPPTITYNAPTPTPILVGSGIPDQNMAVATDCHDFKVAMSAYERFVGPIVPIGKVYSTTIGYSPTSGSDPTPSPNNARWNFLVSVDLGTYDFTQVQVYMDIDFDPGETPVWRTVDITGVAFSQSQQNSHVQQQAQNLKSVFWPLLFPGVSFDPTVPGKYDLRVRIESPTTGTELWSHEIRVDVRGPGCTDPLADNYDATAIPDNSSCTYCPATITYNAPAPMPITVGSGIPDQHMAVSQDCRGIDVALGAFLRYVGPIIPSGNVYAATAGHSPSSGSDPTPDPVMARWSVLGAIDLGTFTFNDVTVYMDADFDPGTTPVWETVDLSAAIIAQGGGATSTFQAAENPASAFWSMLFPGAAAFDPDVPGVYDLRIRLESTQSGEELVNLAIRVSVGGPGCTDPLADNYDASASPDDGSCTYCPPTITYNAPTPTPILVGSGIPDQNMAVSQDCRGIDVAMSAYARYVGPIVPTGNVYTSTMGNSPTSSSNPAPDPLAARWNILGTVDLGSHDFTEVNVYLDLDFDPGATPVWNTVNVSQAMIDSSWGGQHLYQAAENLASPYWALVFPGVTPVNPNVPGIYDVRVRLESAHSGVELTRLAIQVVVEGPGCTDPLADNYDPTANPDDGSCTYCPPTITYNAPTPTPILIGSGIPDQNMAVATDCRGIDVAMSAYARYVGPIVPTGNVYTSTMGNSPTSSSNPAPDPLAARWNILGTVDLGSHDFTEVNVYLDLDFDPGATPVWNTVNVSQAMIDSSWGGQHLYQAAENLASPYWALVFPGVTPVNPNVPGIYDVRVRLESAHSGVELTRLAIQVVVEGCIPHAGNIWYVNDSDLTGDVYTTAIGSDSNTGTAECPFATIAHAIAQASPGDTIMVDAGEYVQDLLVTKQVDLRGAQYNADPTTRTGAETILYPATSDPDPSSNSATSLIYLDDNAASGTKINGFVIDGDNPALTSGAVFNGADMDAIEGIASYLGNQDLDIAFNIIRNFTYAGLDLAHYNGAGSLSGNSVRNNLISNVYSTASGPAIVTHYNFYADVTGNTLEQVRLGIQTGNHINPSTGTPPVISGNTITSYRLGIFHNVQYASATPFTISDNELLTQAGAATNTGIFIGVMDPTTSVTILNNNVTGAQNGIMLWGSNSAAGVTIEGGTITDCGTGVFVNNYDAYPPSPNQTRSTHAIVKDVDIVNATTGIHAKDNQLNTHAAATVHVDITGSTTVNVADGGINLLVTGGKASAQFNGSDVDMTGNALRHIRLESNGSTVPANDIDATQVNFNGSTATTATGFNIEDLIDHKVDLLTLGKVSFVPAEVFVTENSFVAPNTTGSVQRGIDAAVAGDIVHVNDGTYNEDVNVNKAVTLRGNDRDLTILRGLYGTTQPALGIGANATVENLTSTRDFGTSLAQWQASPKTQGVQFNGNNASMNNVRVMGHRNGVYINNRQNIAVANSIIEQNRTGFQLGNTVTGTSILNNFIQDNFTMGVLFNFDLGGTPDISGLTVSGNSITGNWYADISFQGTPSSPVSGADFECNWYGTTHPVMSATATAEPGYAVQVPAQFGGTPPATPAGQIMGVSAGLVPYQPYLINGTDNDPIAPGFQPVPNSCNLIYYSQASGNVSDPIWDVVPVGVPGPAVFTPVAGMVIQTGHAVVNNSTTDVKDLNVETGGTLTLAAGSQLNVNGDEAIFDGNVVAQDLSTLALHGADATILESNGGTLDLWDLTVNTPAGTLTDATIQVRGTLLLQDGTFDASMGTVTLSSTATGTGRLGPVASTADYVGNLTVQRYIPAGRTNWRMLGSPVAGRTVQHWKDDFYTAGFPGSHYPNFYSPVGSGILWPSIRWYDETVLSSDANAGMVGATSNLQPLAMGQGFMAWSGDNLTTTTAFTVDVTGAPYIAHTPLALPMSFSNSGNATADGWNLVSNPLPSPIDFTLISRGSDVQNAYWIFDPVAGNNKAWSGGLGQGTVNGKIQSSQGFWMKANGPDVATTVDEGAKVNQQAGGTFGGSQNPVLPVLELEIASGLNTYSDVTTIVFAEGTPAYGGNDALKMTFKTIGAPQIGVRSTDGQQLAIDFFGSYDSAIQIPVLVDADVSGTYTITAAMRGMQALSCLSLLDLQTGTVTSLDDGATYSFHINADDDAAQPRFILNGTAPMQLSTLEAACPGGDGIAVVQVNTDSVQVTWTDPSGNVLSEMGTVGAGNLAIFEAAPGNYMVKLGPVGACAELATAFSLHAPLPVEVEVQQTATSCPASADGSVHLAINGDNGPYTILWNTGETTEAITGTGGNYTATITDQSGCTSTVAAEIPLGEGAIAQFSTPTGTLLVNVPVQFTNTSVLADSYLWDFGDGTTSTGFEPAHSYALPGTYTVTLTASGGDCSFTTTRPITIAIGTAVTAPDRPTELAVWATPDQLVIVHPFGNAPVDVDVYDATGRLALGRSAISRPERITLDNRSLNTGVWFVRVTSGKVQRTFRVPLVR